MTISWSAAAEADLGRLYDFLAEKNDEVAAETLMQLIEAPERLRAFPRRGSRLSEFNPREVREFRVACYLLRYELSGADIYVLRLFHAREHRF